MDESGSFTQFFCESSTATNKEQAITLTNLEKERKFVSNGKKLPLSVCQFTS